MRAVYEEVKTPYKYGPVVRTPEGAGNVDSPSVFRYRDQWYMVHLVFRDGGYETLLQSSPDLLDWTLVGTILPFRHGAWDGAQAAGYIALQDTEWGGSAELATYARRYWMSYLGGAEAGYEGGALAIGVASTTNPTLATPWQRENGEDREWFAELLYTAPEPADEALLETALDDRRRSVRHFAAIALAQLPASAYAGRMAERARAAIRLERRMLRSALQVTPPEDCDPAMVRDGISPKPPNGTGRQAYWLRRVIGATPLGVWTAIAPPAQLLELRVEGDWRETLLAGWRDAALRRRDPDWALALAGSGLAPDLLIPLIRALAPPDRARTLVVALGGQ